MIEKLKVKNAPPGPKHRFLGANGSFKFYYNIAGYLEEKKQKYGNFFLLKALGHPIYVINDLNYIEQILLKDYKNFTKGAGYQRGRVILGNGIFTSDGEFHDNQRKMINPAFHKNRIREYSESVAECTNDLISDWEKRIRSNPKLEIQREMTRLFIAIIFNSLFSKDSRKELVDLGDKFTELFHGANPMLLLNPQRALKFPIPSVRRFLNAKNELDKSLWEIIRKRKKENTSELVDVLSMIMHAEDNSGKIMSDEVLFDEVRTLFVAANDTSAKIMTWALYVLSQRPDILNKLEEEIEKVLHGDFPGYHDFEKLNYTKMVINETLRLYPPLWMISRTPIEDFNLDGHSIKKDSSIFIVPYLIQRDGKYFDNPELFIPERWTEEEKRKRPRLSFMPFGAGARICVGESFAMYHLVIILTALIQKFRFKLDPEQKVEISSSITLKPKYGMNMLLERK